MGGTVMAAIAEGKPPLLPRLWTPPSFLLSNHSGCFPTSSSALGLSLHHCYELSCGQQKKNLQKALLSTAKTAQSFTPVSPDAFCIGSLATRLYHVYTSSPMTGPRNTTSGPQEPSHLERGCGLCIKPMLDKLHSSNNRVSLWFLGM